MKRILLTWAFAGVCAAGLFAGDFEDRVNELGGPEKAGAADDSVSARKKLREAKLEAYDDLIEGLNRELPIDAAELARASQMRQYCAELLGALKDSRATDSLLKHFSENSATDSEYPVFGSSCAYALAQIWADKEADDTRAKVIDALSTCAEDGTANAKISRYAALRGLALLKTGGTVAKKLLTADVEGVKEEALIRQASIEVIRASNTKSAVDDLAKIWEDQAAGETKDLSKSIGVSAVFALAEFKDPRCIPGLIEILTNRAAFAMEPTFKTEAIRFLKDDDDIKQGGIDALIAIFMSDEKADRRPQTASALGELGAAGVTALLEAGETKPPEGKPKNYYKKRVEDNLSQLNGTEALAAFAEAYRNAGDNETQRLQLISQLLRYRSEIKKKDAGVFKEGANDEELEAAKRGECVAAYATLMGKDSFDALKTWTTSTEAIVRAQAVTGMGSTAIPLSLSTDVLKAVLNDRHMDFFKARENALEGLKRSNDKELLAVFLESMDPKIEKSENVRNRALLSLRGFQLSSGCSEEDMIEAVEARLTDEAELVRSEALNLYVRMAANLGDNEKAGKAVEAGLEDKATSVRKIAFQNVSAVRQNLDTAKVLTAALAEEEISLRSVAVIALANLDSLPEDEDKMQAVIDLCFKVLTERSSDGNAQDLIRKAVDNAPMISRNTIKAVKTKISEMKASGEMRSIVGWISLLITLDDSSYGEEIKKLAELDNSELRKKCVAYLVEFGGKDDINWLRSLRDRDDSAASRVRGDIEAAIKKLEANLGN
ncbi:MAG: hypothetical protein L3J82_04375 [Planctomycetes bacterium]|nr:hypothetical protein [Planctomycetota bacterium]